MRLAKDDQCTYLNQTSHTGTSHVTHVPSSNGAGFKICLQSNNILKICVESSTCRVSDISISTDDRTKLTAARLMGLGVSMLPPKQRLTIGRTKNDSRVDLSHKLPSSSLVDYERSTCLIGDQIMSNVTTYRLYFFQASEKASRHSFLLFLPSPSFPLILLIDYDVAIAGPVDPGFSNLSLDDCSGYFGSLVHPKMLASQSWHWWIISRLHSL